MKGMIRKMLVAGVLGGAPVFATAQHTLYGTSTGEIRFFSETPVENISATHGKAQAVLNIGTGEIAVRMKITDFVFPNKLMQEHFNENYMESTRFPTATFSGKIDHPAAVMKDGTHQVTAQGKLTVHGVTQNRILKGKLTVGGGKVLLESGFEIALTDHKIEVPTIVFVKIAQVIKVTAAFTMEPR